MAVRDRFRTVVVIDTEFNGADQSERHHVIALVGRVYVDGQLVRTICLFEDELLALHRNPLPDGPGVLYVTFVGQAEWRSMLALGWTLPGHCIDLFAEARCLRNLALPKSLRRRLKIRGDGLIDVCRSFGLDASDPLDKEATRDLILGGGPWTPETQRKILDYCERDVAMTADLWFRLETIIPLDQALYRGWFTLAIGDMENRGLPLDVAARDSLVANLSTLRQRLILQFDRFGLCGPDSDTIDPERFISLVGRYNIRWPTTRTGRPEMRLKTIKTKLARYPDLHAVVYLVQGLNDLRGLRDLPIGSDGRARASLWPFSSSTGRNLPSGREFIFQLSRWTRSLIRPEPGRFVCYADWTAQEYAIIAYLSEDWLLIKCYESPGDPYVNLGIVMGLMPEGADKDHPLRDVVKVVVLGLFYGRGVRSIAAATRRPPRFIQTVIDEFWARCPKARRWLESYVDGLFLLRRAWTKFGWTVHHHALTKPTSAANFPVQAHGSEMMRWASCLGFENDVPFCCPVHDAFVCEGRLDDEARIVATLSACMERASAIILGGPTVRAKPVVFRSPERFADKKGWPVWEWIMAAIDPAMAVKPGRTV
jgi:DNA polymerase I